MYYRRNNTMPKIYYYLLLQVPLSYYGQELTPTNIVVHTEFQRSASRGMGGVKYIGNYSPVLKHQIAAKNQGYDDILFLDATYGKYVEEVAASNFFVVKDKVVYTPELTGNHFQQIYLNYYCRNLKFQFMTRISYYVNRNIKYINCID